VAPGICKEEPVKTAPPSPARDCGCAAAPAPVCSADGRTFPSRCAARCIGAKVVADGACVDAAPATLAAKGACAPCSQASDVDFALRCKSRGTDTNWCQISSHPPFRLFGVHMISCQTSSNTKVA